MLKWFIRPLDDVFCAGESSYYKEYKTYTHYNYLRPGIIPYIKTLRFETALRITRQYFHRCNVIDFGCSDGVFLPSLSKYFSCVCGIDNDARSINLASKQKNSLNLTNVDLICNNNLTIDDIKVKLQEKKYHILYLLETLEHIGNKNSLYQSKIDFLKEIFKLVDKNGVVVISVPKMIGIFFFIKYVGLLLFGYHEERITLVNLFKASFLKETSSLEKQWNKGHVGFNHDKLEAYLKNEFNIVKKINKMFSVFYVVQLR